MKNLTPIAALAALSTAALASASVSVVSGGTYNQWTAAAPGTIHGVPVANFTFNTDDLNNASNATATTVTGGYGWGSYLASGTGGSVVQAQNVGGAREIFTGAGDDVNFSFNYGTGMIIPANRGIYGMFIEFTTVPTSGVSLTITWDNGGTYSFSAPTSGTISIWKTDGTNITSVSFAPNANTSGSQSIVIEEISFAFVPAPGAVALVGVAGLVGSRRRRA
jgi:hypothetical protein